MLRIGMVGYPSVGGSGILATELAHQLVKRGHQVHFISYERPFRLKPECDGLHFHPVEILPYELFKYPDYALPLAVKMAQVAREWDLDLFHVHYAIPHATSGLLAKEMLDHPPALVTTLHGTDITLVGKAPSYREIVRMSINRSDVVTAVSQSLKQETMTEFGISRPIEVIPNFFVPKPRVEDRQLIRSRCGCTYEYLLLHSSNFRPVKRVGDVIEVFHKVRQTLPVKLALIGHGSELPAIQRQVAALGLDQGVTFLGVVKEIDSYVAAADLFLLPSEQESFGLAALEAMAYGVPVMASDTGGLPELVEQGVSGRLFPVGATDQMAEGIIELLSDPNRHQEMRERASQRAHSLFSADQIVSQYEALYLDPHFSHPDG